MAFGKRVKKFISKAAPSLFGGAAGIAGLFGKKRKAPSLESARSEAAGRKIVRRPFKGQAGSGQIEFTEEREE